MVQDLIRATVNARPLLVPHRCTASIEYSEHDGESSTAIRRSVQILNRIAKYEGEEITQVQLPDFAQRFENC